MKYVADFLGPGGFGTYEIDWSEQEPRVTPVNKRPELLLVPGFVDVHIHGAFGVDFMSATESEMLELCGRLTDCGYESFLPTTVAASAADVMRAVSNLPDDSMIAGFHLEGPFLSPEFPGAQPRSALVDPPATDSEWDEIFDHPKLKIVTLAPELPHALELIARLTTRGVRVGMGHTNATYEEARRGFEFGVSHATHAFNAMRPFHHREVGPIGYLLSNRTMGAEIIYDRRHVSREAATVLLANKNDDDVVAVSDSTLATGLPKGQTLEMWGQECVTGKDEVRIASTGALAGSCITLLDAFRNLGDDFGAETAVRMCCLNPRKILGWRGRARVFTEMSLNFEILGRKVRERV